MRTKPSCSASRSERASDPELPMKDRRAFLRKAACIGMGCFAGSGAFSIISASAQQQPTIRMVSRERLLREVAVARVLRDEEQRMTDLLQAQVDRAKLALAGEEAELAGLRDQLPKDQFEHRIQDFDVRMRRARQLTQERAAELQKAFQDARASVVAAIPSVIEQLRIEAGAVAVLNADQVLAAETSIDLTDRAVELFDSIGPKPPVPEIDLNFPVTELVTPRPADEAEAKE
ncbi:MAG: OmpH family outer membrane protein [Pseudomonadota bacterium]